MAFVTAPLSSVQKYSLNRCDFRCKTLSSIDKRGFVEVFDQRISENGRKLKFQWRICSTSSDESVSEGSSEKKSSSCGQCEGTQVIGCPLCNGTGIFSIEMMGTASATTCTLCQGRKQTPCPSCCTHIYKSVVWWDQRESDDGQKRSGITWGDPPKPM
uniref:Uncharacterized protein n=1 Tax=Timspurckia oligopyrenoides TaxID=708627 RepID=A0A7S1ESP3_9RHOD|mmetsp:Transcript_500/g.901  ORF Transcript_500/g.901 Transcript_500/m.901 type:complete len:158 (+) Transcript_500:81-554(+)